MRQGYKSAAWHFQNLWQIEMKTFSNRTRSPNNFYEVVKRIFSPIFKFFNRGRRGKQFKNITLKILTLKILTLKIKAISEQQILTLQILAFTKMITISIYHKESSKVNWNLDIGIFLDLVIYFSSWSLRKITLYISEITLFLFFLCSPLRGGHVQQYGCGHYQVHEMEQTKKKAAGEGQHCRA